MVTAAAFEIPIRSTQTNVLSSSTGQLQGKDLLLHSAQRTTGARPRSEHVWGSTTPDLLAFGPQWHRALNSELRALGRCAGTRVGPLGLAKGE